MALIGSTNSFSPCWSRTTSPSRGSFSKSIVYWKPEQPPPATPMRMPWPWSPSCSMAARTISTAFWVKERNAGASPVEGVEGAGATVVAVSMLTPRSKNPGRTASTGWDGSINGPHRSRQSGSARTGAAVLDGYPEMPAAVHRHGGPGHEGGIGEEADGPGDVVGGAHPAERDAACEAPPRGRPVALRPEDGARGHAVHADLRGELEGERLGHRTERRLGRPV